MPASDIKKAAKGLFAKSTDPLETTVESDGETEDKVKESVPASKPKKTRSKTEPIEAVKEKLTADLRILLKPSEKKRAQLLVDHAYSEYDNLSSLARRAMSELLDREEPLVELATKEIEKIKKKLQK